MEMICESSERTGNSVPTTLVNHDSEEVDRIMNQARLGHLLRKATVERCKGHQSSTTDSSGRISRIPCIPVTTSIDRYKNWPLQKHDECWVSRIRNIMLLFGQGEKQHFGTGTGTIEAHVNGFTYSDHGDCDQVFMHRDVQWYFYELGNGRKPPLMQFHLKHPVKIRNTETKDIQFCLVPTPPGKMTSDKDSDNVSSSRNEDLKCRNEELKEFIHKVQETQFACRSGLPITRVNFQALDEFQFHAAFPTGVPTVCALTRTNLVVLKEPPYLVVRLCRFQIVNLACFRDGIEMTVVFRDLELDVLQLRSIPFEFLAGIKHYLNRKDVKYYVNNLSPNWSDIVREIRECPETFIAKGGWDIFEDSITLGYYLPVYTLMKDPVILPSPRITVDRPVIQRHLLGVNWDPFNHSHLTQDMLIPDVELKARIESSLSLKD
ncbi:hypothetical protein C5167_036207 [Papaver somniferum]|nr:hypothetical protein C5167_036207 [Papaver somniferum]